MAIHPLGLVDGANGPEDQQTIQAALAELDRLGPSQWCGYSYSWLGNLAARAQDGERAARALRIFSECFCLPNSFHANGDQSGTGKSNFTYRPFTLEGNFASAAGVQEMLLQSHTGLLHLFPAIPRSWKDVSFTSLRAQGAFLVSAERRHCEVQEVTIVSERGGRLRLANPFVPATFTIIGTSLSSEQKRLEAIEIDTKPGMVLQLKRQ
jgi:alpha-L-fucosidase 2